MIEFLAETMPFSHADVGVSLGTSNRSALANRLALFDEVSLDRTNNANTSFSMPDKALEKDELLRHRNFSSYSYAAKG